MKLFYYAKRFGYNILPSPFFNWNYKRLKRFEKSCNSIELEKRLDYYFKVTDSFEVPETAVSVKDFKKTTGTDYFLDLKDFLNYFSKKTRFAFHFGDETHVNSYPTLFKARPITGDNANSILFKLNKRRHFKWVDDPLKFADKKDRMVWRGGAYLPDRRFFVEKLWNHEKCNIGQTNKPKEEVPWQKEFLSVEEQLKYKFIFCPEGNDVATNLKWVLSSNSLCFMPKPKYETWFMEGTLKPGVHYVELANDLSNFDECLNYYSKNILEADAIIKNANQFVVQFQNEDFEDLLCLKVLERYAALSGQKGLKFAQQKKH